MTTADMIDRERLIKLLGYGYEFGKPLLLLCYSQDHYKNKEIRNIRLIFKVAHVYSSLHAWSLSS